MNFWFDLKYAWRLLKKSWGYTAMCMIVVALSVGLAMWTYALAWSQVLKPLDYPGSDTWYSVQLAPDATLTPRPTVDAYTWQEMLKHNRSAEYLGAFAAKLAVLGEGQAAISLRATEMSPRLFASLGSAPLRGRLFNEADAQSGAAAVAILSYDAWQTYFAGAQNIVGRIARIDAAPVQIVGVMPKDFFAFRDVELWTPLQTPILARPKDSTALLSPLIVVKPGQDPEAIARELQKAVARVNGDHPDLFNAGRHAALIPAARMFNHGNSQIVFTIGFAAIAILLLGCVNISMVFMARLMERSRELALRNALGASRASLLRQCLLETASIVAAGLALGWVLATLGCRWADGIGAFLRRVLAYGRDSAPLELRPSDFGVAMLVAIAVWLLSTLIPAWRVAQRDAAEVLAGSGKGATGPGSNRSVGLLVALQVVISCMVLVVCGNLVLGVRKEARKPSGFDTAQVMLTTAPTVFDERHSEPAKRLRYWDDLHRAIESSVPGTKAAYASAPPSRPVRVSARIETQQGAEKQGSFTLPLAIVSESYFDVVGLKLRYGRLFDSTDNANSLDVAVIDEQLAERYWPDENALGKRVQLNPGENGKWLTVAGVVSGVAGRPYRHDEIGVIYQPLRQAIPPQFHLVLKVPDTATDIRRSLRAAAYSVDRDLPLHNPQTLDDFLAAANLSFHAVVPVFVVIALITVVLAASGLFGLISRSVAQRTQEVGIRRALGATPWRATSMFRRQGAIYLSVSLVGIGIGTVVTSLLSARITNILDSVLPVTAGVVTLMAVVIFTASYLPTRRAMALEPGDALRYD